MTRGAGGSEAAEESVAPEASVAPPPSSVAPTVQIAPQRAVILLPSTGQFDSRTWRIAGDLARRGHTVTVLARSGPGLPDVEAGPSGSRIIRVPVSAVDGLPSPLRAIARR
ncbi:MAG TPA: hypothetical protein VK194_01820, partial [Candidatus Deferrimicrobium sp.]|nr:hypothetical protein [Candidatus Deferrimicrobium sp.]